MKFSRGIRAKLAAITRSVRRSYFTRILPQFIVNYFIHSDTFSRATSEAAREPFKAARARTISRCIPRYSIKIAKQSLSLSLSLSPSLPQSSIPPYHVPRKFPRQRGGAGRRRKGARGERNLRQRTSARNRENERVPRQQARLRASESAGNYVRLHAGDVRCHGWRVFREHSGREIRGAEAAGARCGALMTGNRQYELDGSVPHRVPQ